MNPHVDQQLVAGVERLALAWTHLPHARKVVHLSLLYVGVLYVLDYLLEVDELLPTAVPEADTRFHHLFLHWARVMMVGGVVEGDVVMVRLVIGGTPALGVWPEFHEFVLGCRAVCRSRRVSPLWHHHTGASGGELGVQLMVAERDLVCDCRVFGAPHAVTVFHRHLPLVDPQCRPLCSYT